MRKSPKFFLPVLSIGALSLLSLGCSGNDAQSGNGRGKMVPAVEAVKAQHGSLPLTERMSGVVKARNQTEIFPKITAIISTVQVENGEKVKQGQPLVTLRDREFKERYNQAEAALKIAQAQARQAEAKLKEVNADLNRSRTLFEKNLTNEAEMQAVETRALSAKADLELAEARVNQESANLAEMEEILSYTVIRAPIDGVVGNRNAEIGMTVSPSTQLFTIGQLDSVRIEVILTDRMLTYLESGQRATIDAGNASHGILEAPLSRISPFLNPITHSTKAEIDMENPNQQLISGMFVKVDINYGESEQATIVPLSALYENPLTGGTGVYVARDSLNRIITEPAASGSSIPLTEPVIFEFVPVKIVAKGRMSVGVVGIEPDQWVVTIGQDLFGGNDGSAKVRPVQWSWVEHLQNLQREDLLEEVVKDRDSQQLKKINPGI